MPKAVTVGSKDYEEAMKLWSEIKTPQEVEVAKNTWVGTKIFLLLESARKAWDPEAIGALALYYAQSWFVNQNLPEAESYLKELGKLSWWEDIWSRVRNQIQERLDSIKRKTLADVMYTRFPQLQSLLDDSKVPEDCLPEVLRVLYHCVIRTSHDSDTDLHDFIKNLFSNYLVRFKSQWMTSEKCLFFARIVYENQISYLDKILLDEFWISIGHGPNLLKQALDANIPWAKALSIWLKIKEKVDSNEGIVSLIAQLDDLRRNWDIFASEYIKTLRKS